MKLVKKDWAGRKFAFHSGKVEVDSSGIIDIDQKEKEAIDIFLRMGFKPIYNRPEKLENSIPIETEIKSEEKAVEEKPEEEKPSKFMGSFKKKKGRVG